MRADAGRLPGRGGMVARRPPAAVPLRVRLGATGSVFGKTLRDSRAAALVVLALTGVMVVAAGVVMDTTYGTPATRAELGFMARTVPEAMRGLYGAPIAVDTIGGFISWHYGSYLTLIPGLWSILALSGTLAGEARRGSLDLTVATPASRRAIALHKIAGHATALAVVAGAIGALAWGTASALALIPTDPVSPAAAAAFAVGIWVRALAAGGIAFALGPVLGRGASAGIAGAILLTGYVASGYRGLVPALDPVATLTWWSWAAGHIPLAGTTDWGGLGATALAAVAGLGLGVVGFERRDIGGTFAIAAPRLPALLVGVRGPLGRATGELLGPATWWGIGLGLYGVAMTAISASLVEVLASWPGLAEVWRRLIPGVDITTTAGYLQLAFVELGTILMGLVVTTFVALRWGDETSGRLEALLAAPLSRRRWAVTAGLAVVTGAGLVVAILAASIAAGIAIVGEDPWTPALGTVALGAYGVALAGVGMAAGGIAGARLAGPAVAAVAVVTFLLDTLAPMLRLPAWVGELALTAHLGEPMVGRWDPGGIALCVLIGATGIGAGAWGLGRRDLAG